MGNLNGMHLTDKDCKQLVLLLTELRERKQRELSLLLSLQRTPEVENKTSFVASDVVLLDICISRLKGGELKWQH